MSDHAAEFPDEEVLELLQFAIDKMAYTISDRNGKIVRSVRDLVNEVKSKKANLAAAPSLLNSGNNASQGALPNTGKIRVLKRNVPDNNAQVEENIVSPGSKDDGNGVPSQTVSMRHPIRVRQFAALSPENNQKVMEVLRKWHVPVGLPPNSNIPTAASEVPCATQPEAPSGSSIRAAVAKPVVKQISLLRCNRDKVPKN